MVEFKAKVNKVGGSNMITIPIALIKNGSLKVNTHYTFKAIEEEGKALNEALPTFD